METDFSVLEKYLREKKTIIDKKLAEYIPLTNETKLSESIRYSLLVGGKRLRPILTLATADIFNFDEDSILPSACAVEMIHTQSLIHDDLPGMDNDDLRRGNPTNHIVYGEALAIIAGDALFSHAFYTITSKTPKYVSTDRIIKVIEELSISAGLGGMCEGQTMDISFEKSNIELTPKILEYIHSFKTGAMIRASVRIGAILAGCSEEELNALTTYSEKIGLAFQIIDDILDETKTTEELGKKAKKDISKNKATYPRLYGVEKSMNLANETVNLAINAIKIFGSKADKLELLAKYIIERSN